MAADEITVVSPPSTTDVTQQTLAMMAALTGVLTDYNQGSQVRTMVESFGGVIEQQGIGAQTLALQAIVVSALSLFKISPAGAVPAQGAVTFNTGTGSNPPPATQSVQIPAGTIVQTAGGVQFFTTEAATLQSGGTSISVNVQAVIGGSTGNVATGAIVQIVSGLTYPLVVSNAAPTAGGIDAQSASQGLSTLAAKIASLIAGSPVAIANGVIGVIAPGSQETVQYSTCYEPWVAAGTGAGSGVAGFTLYVDNGAGTASSALLAAVKVAIDGNQSKDADGLRPAGVPYSIDAVVPVYADVFVVGTVNSLANTAVVSGSTVTAVQSYFAGLQFGSPAEQSQLSALVSNAAIGALTSLTVTLAYAAASGTAVNEVTGLEYNRIILNNLSITLTGGG